MIEAGWYYDPEHSGWGISIVKDGEASGVVTIYFNSPRDGMPVWLQASGVLGGRMDVVKYIGDAFPGTKNNTRTVAVGVLTLGPYTLKPDATDEGDATYLMASLTLSPQGYFNGTGFSPAPPQFFWSGWLTKIA